MAEEPRGSTDGLFGAVTRSPSLAEEVTQALMDLIKSGRLMPGDELPAERELGNQFGVSRTIIREAVRSLQAKGLIEVRSGRGARVSAVPASQITETIKLFLQGAKAQDLLDAEKISEVRTTLEVRIVELACERATDADLERLQRAVEAMDADEDVERASEHDVEFHRLIASATYNALFVLLLDSIGDILMEIRRRSLAVEGRKDRAVQEHRRIADALQARDVAAARQAMIDHLEDSRSYYTADPQV